MALRALIYLKMTAWGFGYDAFGDAMDAEGSYTDDQPCEAAATIVTKTVVVLGKCSHYSDEEGGSQRRSHHSDEEAGGRQEGGSSRRWKSSMEAGRKSRREAGATIATKKKEARKEAVLQSRQSRQPGSHKNGSHEAMQFNDDEGSEARMTAVKALKTMAEVERITLLISTFTIK
jgi:hypothetical protein